MIGVLCNNRYRLDAELGQGGMGVVYRAHDTLLDRDVAVKVLSAVELGSESRTRLLHEARSAAQLNHPNIVAVYDAGETELPGIEATLPFIVMELVEGTSLLQRRPAELEETLAIASQVCAALDHAHARGIVHRDLKPENVLLAPDGTAKLNDFGLARSVASRLTGEGTIVGTVFYLAPELALGKQFDGRADLYALGVMLYELVTGELPFVAEDPIAVISQHLHAPPVPPRARNPAVPPALEDLILGLLSKQPDDRPGSAAEVREVLLRLATGTEAPGATAEVAEEFSMLDRIVRGRMVGREKELAQVRALWQRSMAGEGHVLLISGEPGIGKTRLVRELLTHAQVAGGCALVAECYPEGGAPYAPFVQILGAIFQNGVGAGLQLPDFVMADLLALAPTLRLRFPDVPPNPKLDPRSEQQRLFENMVALCAALCERAPVLLALEDAHWADSGSLALLRHLARRTRRRRVLIVVTYREVEIGAQDAFQELLVDLNRERLATRLKLGRLDPASTRDLLAALFAQEITPEFMQGIYRETEGNPFFIEEVCKALVESGELTFVDGRWHRPSMEQLGIPQSVRMAIHSRVGRLSQAAQETLHMAAILGSDFQFEILAAASDLDEDALIDALEAAERAQLIQEAAGRGDVAFVFAHTLIPATLTEAMPTLRRRRLHRRAALAIERLRPEDYEALAHHWSAAGDEERALTYCIRAGERAAAAFANADAERYFRTALELVDGGAGRAQLLGELGRVLARQSRYWEAIELWKEAIGLYLSLGDLSGASRLYARSARAAWYAGDTPRGLAICREGIAAVSGAADSPDLADLLHETARACLFNGLMEEAEALCRQALELAERLGAVRVQAEALTTLGCLPRLPAEQCIAALTGAIDLAEAAGLLNQASRAHHDLAYAVTLRVGDLASARDHYLRAAELSRKRGAIVEEIFSRAAATDVALFRGDLARAEEELREQQRLLENTYAPGAAMIVLHLTEALLRRYRGELDLAAQQLESALSESRSAGYLQMLSWLLMHLIDVLLELGREAEAEKVLHEACALEDVFPERGFAARCRMCQHWAEVGQVEAARRKLPELSLSPAERTTYLVDAAWLSWAEAALATAEGRWSESWAAFQGTVGALTSMGMRWYRARALRDWAAAHLARRQVGDRERAQDLLREAIAEFEAMGASFYARQVEMQLRDLGREGGVRNEGG